MELLLFPVIIFFVAIAALSVLLHFVPIGLWISALAADVNIPSSIWWGCGSAASLRR